MKSKDVKVQSKTKAKEPKAKTPGTIMAEKLRAQLNGITDSERERLINEGMAMIYSGYANAKTHANSR